MCLYIRYPMFRQSNVANESAACAPISSRWKMRSTTCLCELIHAMPMRACAWCLLHDMFSMYGCCHLDRLADPPLLHPTPDQFWGWHGKATKINRLLPLPFLYMRASVKSAFQRERHWKQDYVEAMLFRDPEPPYNQPAL